jgi:hypothetical protein
MPTVKELKDLIKNSSTEKPKLSAGKEALLLYAEKAGLLKKAEPVTAREPVAVKPEPKVKAAKIKLAEPEELPVELKKPAEKVTKKTAAPAPAAPAKKAPSAFAAFMSSHKGQGMTMSQLAAKFKELK